ncbi:MAG: hypothetical protein GC129_03655 [Proteobacteria bacterium]|nr:hypothetical protein [Pseudomonadota bacterium]
MKELFAFALAVGCLSASHGLALEAVAMPSDGAGSGSGAATYALGNQITVQGAAIGAQSAVLQQVQQALTSLTTVVNDLNAQVASLTQYVADTTCVGGTLTTTNGKTTCTGGTNGSASTSSASSASCYAGTSMGPGYDPPNTYLHNVAFPNGTVIAGWPAYNGGPAMYQCLNGKWIGVNVGSSDRGDSGGW